MAVAQENVGGMVLLKVCVHDTKYCTLEIHTFSCAQAAAFKGGRGKIDDLFRSDNEKNLKVKLPKGKQFNFTDPQGNADHLFVFHRDVEKARERLKKGDLAATN